MPVPERGRDGDLSLAVEFHVAIVRATSDTYYRLVAPPGTSSRRGVMSAVIMSSINWSNEETKFLVENWVRVGGTNLTSAFLTGQRHRPRLFRDAKRSREAR
jgi:hypothetical protein